jgi:acetyl esterase/lipase
MRLHRRRFLRAAGVPLALPWLDGFSPRRALAGAEEPRVVELWPDKPPEEPGTIGEEKTFPSKPNKQRSETTEVTRLITNVTKPTITIHRPAKEKDTGGAMLICPGGGYHNLWWQLEGEEVGTWLNSIGVTGILLKYRVPRRPDDLPGEHPARRPLQDAQRAVSLVRSNAKAWGLDPQRIGIVGFSAGGHLAIATATSFGKRTYEPIDNIDKVSCRPDCAVPVYSGYLKSEDKDELAAGLRVPANTPPVFLVHGSADPVSPPEHSVVMYLALRRAGIPTELHVYAGALHGFGVRPVSNPCGTWIRSCANWMHHRGFLKA